MSKNSFKVNGYTSEKATFYYFCLPSQKERGLTLKGIHLLLPKRSIYELVQVTIKILKFGTPQTIAIIVLKIEKFDVTLHLCIQKMLMEWQTA